MFFSACYFSCSNLIDFLLLQLGSTLAKFDGFNWTTLPVFQSSNSFPSMIAAYNSTYVAMTSPSDCRFSDNSSIPFYCADLSPCTYPDPQVAFVQTGPILYVQGVQSFNNYPTCIDNFIQVMDTLPVVKGNWRDPISPYYRLNGPVYYAAYSPYDQYLYITGMFQSTISNSSVSFGDILRTDGKNFYSLGAAFDQHPQAIVFAAANVTYMGGTFSYVNPSWTNINTGVIEEKKEKIQK